MTKILQKLLDKKNADAEAKGPQGGPSGPIGENFVDTKVAAIFLGVSASWLTKSRMDGSGPVHRKFGASVRYAVDDLVAWADAQRVGGNGEAA